MTREFHHINFAVNVSDGFWRVLGLEIIDTVCDPRHVGDLMYNFNDLVNQTLYHGTSNTMVFDLKG